MAAEEEGVSVDLYIYDLSLGLAPLLSPSILGRRIEGIWHTSVVVYDREYFYGAGGITSCAPGSTSLGAPPQVERLGRTFVPFQVFVDYIEGLAASTYAGAHYRLLEHNCNHFSDEVAQFLCGAAVPKHILRQPDELSPPLRLALQAMLDNVVPADQSSPVYASGVRHSRRDSPEFTTLNTQIEEARAAAATLDAQRTALSEKLARRQRRRDKRRAKHGGVEDDDADQPDMAEGGVAIAVREEPAAGTSEGDNEERRRPADPPVVYTDIDGAQEFDKLTKHLEKVQLSAEEQQSLEELQQYLVQGEGSWVLGDEFLNFIGRLLSDPSLPAALRVSTLRCLAAAALREDVSLLLHQDRRAHALLGFAQSIDKHEPDEQLATALFICNLFENVGSSEWLLYISEWDYNGQALSNIRVTTKVCVHALLGSSPELRELGTALMHNIATKEVKTVVFDEVCVELGMAILELLNSPPPEEQLFRVVKALAKLAQHSSEVPQLISMLGPDPSAFRGTSPRVDEQIELILQKVK